MKFMLCVAALLIIFLWVGYDAGVADEKRRWNRWLCDSQGAMLVDTLCIPFDTVRKPWSVNNELP